MRVKLQLVLCDDAGQEETVTDVVTLKKDSQRLCRKFCSGGHQGVAALVCGGRMVKIFIWLQEKAEGTWGVLSTTGLD